MAGCGDSAGSGDGSGGQTAGDPTSSNGGTNGGGANGVATGTAAGDLARRLGREHFLIGLHGPDFTPTGKLDIMYRYLVRTTDPSGAWIKWNTPDGEYATLQAMNADAGGAIPMFSTYEFIAFGEGNMEVVADTAYMALFWSDMRLLAEKLSAFDKPAIVHSEPDFWGFAQQKMGNDPTVIRASVPTDGACAGLPQDLTGVARCIVRIFHQAAPKVIVGLHASVFGAYAGDKPDGMAVGTYMRTLTGGEADYIVVETLDRDAGCFEANPPDLPCSREGSGWYWDETNATSPNFHEAFAWASSMQKGAQVPLLWWQTPLGVPSDTPGGTAGRFRDNRVRYFMGHIDELVAAGAFGAAFGAGAEGMTTQKTDGGQFERALNAYNESPFLFK